MGGGQTAGISNCTVQNKRRRYTFKINTCTGLTLREEKGATRKECKINQFEFTHKKLDRCGINYCEWVKMLENAEFISVNPQNLLNHTDFKNEYFQEKYYKSLLFLSITNAIYNEIHKIFCLRPNIFAKQDFLFIYLFLHNAEFISALSKSCALMRNLLVSSLKV